MAHIALNKVLADFCSHDWTYQEHNISFYTKLEGILNCCICGCELELNAYFQEGLLEEREESFDLLCKDGILPSWHDEIEVQFLVNYKDPICLADHICLADPIWLADGHNIMFEGYSCNAITSLKEKIQMLEALA